MQGQILSAKCATSMPAVAHETCNTFEAQPRGIIITTADFFIPPLVDKLATLIAAAKAYPNTKVFPIMDGLVNVEPSGGDARIAQEGFGESSVNGNNPYQETLTLTRGGLCLYKQLTKLHGQNLRIFLVDVDFKAYGTVDNEGNTRGFAMNLGVAYRKNVGTTTAGIILTVLYSNAYNTEFINVASFIVSENIRARKSVSLFQSGYDDDVIRFKLLTCSGVDVTANLSAIVTANDFVLTNVSTGVEYLRSVHFDVVSSGGVIDLVLGASGMMPSTLKFIPSSYNATLTATLTSLLLAPADDFITLIN